jgi:hypothetical protein
MPFFSAPRSESGPGYLENCASYTGCTDEEYCQTWGLRCDLAHTSLHVTAREAAEKDAA